MSVDLEAHTLGLNDMQGLEVGTLLIAAFFRFLHEVGEEVEGFQGRGDPVAFRCSERVFLQRRRDGAVHTQLEPVCRLLIPGREV